MRGLLLHSGFEQISSKVFMPFTYKEYAELQNVRRIQVECGKKSKKTHVRVDDVHILGRKSRIGNLDSLYDTAPDIYAYMAEKAYSYNNIFFSQCGNAFLDNFRFYHQSKEKRNQTFGLSKSLGNH